MPYCRRFAGVKQLRLSWLKSAGAAADIGLNEPTPPARPRSGATCEHPQGPGLARPGSARGRKKTWGGPALS